MEENEKTICMCMDVTEIEIINAIKNDNCRTAQEVGRITGAGTICGGCKGITEKLITENL